MMLMLMMMIMMMMMTIMINRMIDAQIGVAKKQLSFSEQSNKFGHELHDKFIKPKIADSIDV